MTGRVPGSVQHDDAAVAEHVLVPDDGLDLPAAADPMREIRRIDAGIRLGFIQGVPVAFADQQCRLRKGRHLADVIAVIMADPDEGDLLRLQVQLRELFHQA